ETNHGYQESCTQTRQEGGQEDCPQVRQGEDRHGTQDRTQDGAEGCEESSEEAGTQTRCQEDRAQAHREEGRDGQDGARQQDQACEEGEEVSNVATVSRCLRHHNHKPAFPAAPSAGMRAIRMTLAPVLPGLSVFRVAVASSVRRIPCSPYCGPCHILPMARAPTLLGPGRGRVDGTIRACSGEPNLSPFAHRWAA